MKITKRQLRQLIQEAIRQNEPGFNRQYPSERRVKYTALVLDDRSHQALIRQGQRHVPNFDQWNPVAHHMTLISPPMQGKFSRLPERFIGQPASITAVGIVFDNSVAAAVIDLSNSSEVLPMDGPSFPHVTVGINKKGPGGNKKNNASMSNNLNPGNMTLFVNPILLTGVIKEL